MNHAFPVNYLTTADQQQVAYDVLGSPERIPLLHIHGGPGSGANSAEAVLLNHQRHFIIMFDQRGCGRSQPAGDITSNTTQLLIDDIEQLRQLLDLEHWKIYGGSWGATLAIEYAKQYPHRVSELILRGSFPARKQDLDWFIQPNGVARQQPVAYQRLCAALEADPDTPLTSHLYRLLLDARQSIDHHERAYDAALAWDHWEAAIMGLPAARPESLLKEQHKRIQRKLIYAHYCHHQFFLGEDGVMPNLERLKDIKVTLVHGRHDQVCPLDAARALWSKLPNAKFVPVSGGHSIHDKAIREALWRILSY